MDEILQKLLNSELLSEEAKAEISTSWASAVDEFKSALREETALEVRSEIATQWASERDLLIDNVESFVQTKLDEEISDLKADVERFRDLEAEFAEKIVEEKHTMAEQLSTELDALIDKMDAFFEVRLVEEFTDLREDLEIVKQNDFGRRMFEAFSTEFNKSFVDEESVQSQLVAAEARLAEAAETIESLQETQAKMLREAKLEQILSPLSGRKREQMQFVLANVGTSRLEEAYNQFISRVLKDETKDSDRPLLESTVVTGDESAPKQQPSVDKYLEIKKLAGII